MPARSARSGAKGKKNAAKAAGREQRDERRDQREPVPGDQPGPAAGDGGLPAGRFLDREESWLRWNQRVLELAEDETVPLLERVRFLAIFASNLDEFFMVRVAGRMRRMAAGLPVESTSGRTSREILQNTLQTARELALRHSKAFAASVQPALSSAGIEILRWKELSASEQDELHTLFRDRVYPVLTPLIVDPAHPFPYISGLSLSLAVMIADPRTGGTMFARVKVPPLLPRFIALGAAPVRAAGGRDRGAPGRAVRRPRRAGAARVPGHQDQGPGDRRGRHREPAPVAGARAAAPPVRAGRAAGGGGVHLQRRAGPAGHRAGHRTGRRCTGCPARWTCPA